MKSKKGKQIKASIIIPVHNEKKTDIFLENILNNNTLKDYEIIVVDSNNLTINQITNKNIVKISSKKGRATQMNEGAKVATSSILVFLHCDTILPDGAFELIYQTLDDKIVAGAFDLSFDSDDKIITYIAKIASYRSRITRLPYGDQTIFIKKDIFFEVGGYTDMPLMEDVNLMQKLKKHNYKIKILRQKIITSSRKLEENGPIKNSIKNFFLVSLYYIGFDIYKLAKYY
ncbi:MAG: glycosyltransferase [Epsilonproteobacteria bacterium]|nr:MAG: glycosyltransferase [Campylobacterota bacterium]